MAFNYTVTALNCVCRPGKPCAYHATIRNILDSGVGLEQRLAVVDHSTLAANQHEATIIRAELAERRRKSQNDELPG